MITIAISFVIGYSLGAWITYCQFRKAVTQHNQRPATTEGPQANQEDK